MSRLDRLLLAPLALLACACAVLVAGVCERVPGALIEIGAVRRASVSPETRARLAALDEEVLVTWYRTPPAAMPSHLRGLERGVREALGALRDASAGRLEFQVLDPDAHPEWSTFLAAVGVAPWRARRVERDGWSEERLWSSLRITCGARAGAVVNGVGPAELAQLQTLVLAHIDELRAPRRPLVALDAPAGFDRLRAGLAASSELREVDFERDPGSVRDADLLVWLDPDECAGPQLAALDGLLARGASALVAGSEHRSVATTEAAQPRVRIEPSGFAARALLAHFGLRAADGLVLDPNSAGYVTVADRGAVYRRVPAPFRVRAIAPNQDFRTFRGQPNGGLAFVAPTAFEPEPDRLGALGLEATTLVTTTERALVIDPPRVDVGFDELAEARGRPAGKLALAAALRPSDPLRGTLVVMGAADALGDERGDDESYAHAALARVLFDTLLAPERRVASRVALARPAPIGQLDGAARAGWRAFVVALGPALLALVGLRRFRAGARLRRRHAGTSGLGALGLRGLALRALLALSVAIALTLLLPDPGIDLSRDARNRPSAAERAALARWAGDEPVRLELWTSAPERLPPELRARARAALSSCRVLARALPDARATRVQVDALDAEALAQVGELGLGTHLARSRVEEATSVRRVVCALRVVRGERAEVLELPVAAAFDALRFRVAAALWRLATERAPTVALVADGPRLSPAEAALEYQQQGLFAPAEGDVYSELRALLEHNDFGVRSLDSDRPTALATDELLFWVQPRRDVRPMLARLAQHLAAGGHAIVAAQHYELLARQLASEELALTFWPRPLFCDLDALYLPALGVSLARELLFDRLSAPLEVMTRVERADGGSEYVPQQSSQPFVLRAAEANRPLGGEVLRGVGDLLFPFGNRVALDAELLAARGIVAEPWIATSSRPWSYAWSGGDLPAAVLTPPEEIRADVTRFNGPAALAVRLRGTFPAATVEAGADGEPELVVQEASPAAPVGELLLIGGSRPFRNELLRAPDFRHDLFALRAVAELLLGPDLAQFLRQRAAAPGFDYVSPGARGVWRALVVGLVPLLLVGLALLRRLRR